jgi:hypothetical protein
LQCAHAGSVERRAEPGLSRRDHRKFGHSDRWCRDRADATARASQRRGS